MPRFFVNAGEIGDFIRLSGSDAAHVRVLRLKAGDEITLCDGSGRDYRCVIAEINRDFVEAEVLESLPSKGEPSVEVYVYLAYAKGDRLSFADHHEVGAFDQFGFERRFVYQRFECVYRPDVGIQAEFLT